MFLYTVKTFNSPLMRHFKRIIIIRNLYNFFFNNKTLGNYSNTILNKIKHNNLLVFLVISFTLYINFFIDFYNPTTDFIYIYYTNAKKHYTVSNLLFEYINNVVFLFSNFFFTIIEITCFYAYSMFFNINVSDINIIINFNNLKYFYLNILKMYISSNPITNSNIFATFENIINFYLITFLNTKLSINTDLFKILGFYIPQYNDMLYYTSINYDIMFFMILLMLFTLFFSFIYYNKLGLKTIILSVNIIFILCLLYILFIWLNLYTFEQKLYINLNHKFNFLTFKIEIFNFYISLKSFLFIQLVLTIFIFSFYYANYYMMKDQKNYKFLFLLALFAISMVFLVHSNNIILLFTMWEMIGLSSFFLIGYYNLKISIFKSALKAMFVNKWSDILFLVSIILYFYIHKNFLISSTNSPNLNVTILNFFFFKIELKLLFLIFLTFVCFVKSAQFCFTTWLIDSMDAPVPASALIHSATLVISGIYIVFLFKHHYLMFPNLILFILIVSSTTSVYSSICACLQSDLKKILANSTISNCGLLFLFVFMAEDIWFYIYIIVHGFLKSLVFLMIGYIFLLNKHKQDYRTFNKDNATYNFALLILFLSLIMLSASPLTINYDLKHSILYSTINFEIFYINILINVNIFLVSLFSFFYSYMFIKKLNYHYFKNYGLKYNSNSLPYTANSNYTLTKIYTYYFLVTIIFILFILFNFYNYYIFFTNLNKNFYILFFLTKIYIFLIVNITIFINFYFKKFKNFNILFIFNFIYLFVFL